VCSLRSRGPIACHAHRYRRPQGDSVIAITATCMRSRETIQPGIHPPCVGSCGGRAPGHFAGDGETVSEQHETLSKGDLRSDNIRRRPTAHPPVMYLSHCIVRSLPIILLRLHSAFCRLLFSSITRFLSSRHSSFRCLSDDTFLFHDCTPREHCVVDLTIPPATPASRLDSSPHIHLSCRSLCSPPMRLRSTTRQNLAT
jgi:hypothetical protein